jgi:uncharacterized protein YbbC (DUF1343 family)
VSGVKCGIEFCMSELNSNMQNCRIGLACNHTALTRDRTHLLDLLRTGGATVSAIFSPEHGFQGRLDEPVASGVHEPTGIPIHSLFGSQQKPAPEMLAGLDLLIYDIADIGVRFYTYTTTMTHCQAAAAQAGLPFMVLDRPNPIRGDLIEGPILDVPQASLSAWHELPLRHGLTSGELALWANDHYGLHADLRVVPCQGWTRDMWFHETGLPWVNPSPNMRNVRQTLLYPAVGTLEACNLSVGRGTDTPFEWFGAPWMDDLQIVEALNTASIAEMSFVPVRFTPASSKFAGEECRGVYIVLGDWERCRPVTAAVQIALTLRRLYPEAFDCANMYHLLGSRQAVAAIGDLRAVEDIVGTWAGELEAYRGDVERYLLY